MLVAGFAAAAEAQPEIPEVTVVPAFPRGAPETPSLSCSAALLLDVDTGEVLWAKNEDKRLPMASTTKIMTAILVLESLDLDTEVVVSRNAHFQRGSVVGLNTLDRFTVQRLLYWMLVFSGNDAAVALAEKTSGSETKFVAEMNQKAKALGLTNTHFRNPGGLDANNHYSSCTDLAAMASYAMENDFFRKAVSTVTYTYPHPSAYTPKDPKNSNALLAKYEWVTGIKTGSTPDAGYCLVASGTQNGVSLLLVLLGAKNDATRWREAEALFDYGFGLSPTTALAQPGWSIAEIPVGDPLEQSVTLIPQGRLVARLRTSEVATGTIVLSRDLALPIRGGETLGAIEYSVDGDSIGTVTLLAGNSVYPPTFRRILVHARNWCLPEYQLNDRGGRYPR